MVRLRAGRLSNQERLIILNALGRITQQRFNKNLKHNGQNYNLGILRDSLQFSPDINNFSNDYWIDTGDQKLNEIADYFEYGTGLYNVKHRGTKITSPRGKKLKFRKAWHGIKFASSVKGVKPIFMMAKAVKSVENEKEKIQREIRIKLGI